MAQVPLQEAAQQQEGATHGTEGEEADELEPPLVGRDVARGPEHADVPAHEVGQRELGLEQTATIIVADQPGGRPFARHRHEVDLCRQRLPQAVDRRVDGQPQREQCCQAVPGIDRRHRRDHERAVAAPRQPGPRRAEVRRRLDHRHRQQPALVHVAGARIVEHRAVPRADLELRHQPGIEDHAQAFDLGGQQPAEIVAVLRGDGADELVLAREQLHLRPQPLHVAVENAGPCIAVAVDHRLAIARF
jgi:hypothetical protein